MGNTIQQALKNLLRLTLLAVVSIALGCKGDQQFTYLEDQAGSGGSENPEVGNSALAFSPSSLDFGPAAQSVDNVIKLVTVENTSEANVFIDSFTGTNSHFTLITDNCPVSPSPLATGDDCQLTIQFAPQSAGSLTTTLIVNYGDAPGENDLISIMGLSGTGVGSLSFGGISSIDQVTHKSVRINWTAEPLAVSYMIFRVMGGGSLNYQDSVINTGGTLTNHTLTGLTPNTAYTFRVKAIDSLGSQDGNTTDELVSTNANQAPVLNSITPPVFYSGIVLSNINASDANTNTDVDIDGDAITYSCRYDNVIDGLVLATASDCTTLANESGGNPSFNAATGIFSGWEPRHADVGINFEFEIEGVDPYGSVSKVTFSGTTVAGTPAIPVVNNVAPSGPVNNNNPTVSGTGEATMTINLFTNSSCSSAVLATTTVDGLGDWSTAINVSDNTVTTIFAQAENVIGNDSACSATSATFQEDSAAPAIVVLSTTPATFGDSLTPAVNGISEANASIEIFSDSGCTTSLQTDTANAGGAFATTVTVVSESTTTFYAKASDAAGNVSACSATNATYTAFPIDPNNLSIWLDSQDSTNLFQSNSCTGTTASSISDPVGCMKDKSGSGNNFAIASNKPVVGNDGILFNGTTNFLTNATVSLDHSSDITYFIAVKLDTQTTNGGSCCRPFLSWTTGSTGLYPWVGQTRGDYTPANNIIFGWQGGGLGYTPIIVGDIAIISVFHDGTLGLWNTYFHGSQNVSNHAIPASYTTTNLILGGDSGNLARLFVGEILEIIMYDEIISSSRREDLEGYLACKYNTRDLLALAHPYYHATGSDNTGCP